MKEMYENRRGCENDWQFLLKYWKIHVSLESVIEYSDICSFNISEIPEEEKMVVEPKVVQIEEPHPFYAEYEEQLEDAANNEQYGVFLYDIDIIVAHK